jgi:hypothetical protein
VCAEDAVDEGIERVLRRQLADGFPDIRGAQAAVTLPISERLLNEVLVETIPRSVPITDLQVTPEADDRFVVRFRVGSSSLIPRLKMVLAIETQPDLPALPILVLRLETTGLMLLAGPALRLFNALPAGITVKDDRIHVDLRALAERRGFVPFLDYLDQLRVNTVSGAVVLTVHGRIR